MNLPTTSATTRDADCGSGTLSGIDIASEFTGSRSPERACSVVLPRREDPVGGLRGADPPGEHLSAHLVPDRPDTG